MKISEAKKEAIKKAYGEYWYKLSSGQQFIALSNNGWLHFNDTINYSGSIVNCIEMQVLEEIDCYRPKSLEGIDNNNGWIRIESEDDLPNHKLWFSDGKDVWQGNLFEMEFFAKRINTLATHYQPIVKPKPPIY
jgi:hypothetical protein